MSVDEIIKPNAMSTLSTWLCYLEHIHTQTIELGLTRAKLVADRLSINKPAPYVFTVAGTNGKGTTCHTLEMILMAAGYKVGVYSSPHLIRYTERVRIQNKEVAEAEHVKTFAEIEKARGDTSLTYFEFSTLSALLLFKQANVDVAILEVGLGGRLDATNIVDSDVAVVTSIALDHTDWLGDNRESIGREKAGIFRAGCPAVVGEPDMPMSIANYAKQLGALLYPCKPNSAGVWSYQLESESSWSFTAPKQQYQHLPVPTVPVMNAATALAALSYSSLTVPREAIDAGLRNARLPGRFQIIQQKPWLILDVAHNPHAAIYLNSQLDKMCKNHSVGKVRMVIGMLKDKDIASTLSHLQADKWYCASLYGPRGASAEQLTKYLADKKADLQAFSSVVDAWQCAMQEAQDDDIVVVCGSFHTVADVMSHLNHEE
ncbi:bifunctional tetrahydrofolate synthase/dihydrofolate synthase [Zophobihabitans entericus]|uniref:Dihydrofolate synthase/folylpolyglutamate synthase n=1 Tax=Zophobihabitans entericus TaxID=1635327 RepID=A0A6G9I9X5_9GAMM|nr:bifunctional tetrahydrofolate synthase/dihydrofolate synthase [Zophobihabitans entericus]QIQ20637.1 bifunctional tetrahydrofolate synthase/dihydrofolate synthase [Zophobihabitans entericus]